MPAKPWTVLTGLRAAHFCPRVNSRYITLALDSSKRHSPWQPQSIILLQITKYWGLYVLFMPIKLNYVWHPSWLLELALPWSTVAEACSTVTVSFYASVKTLYFESYIIWKDETEYMWNKTFAIKWANATSYNRLYLISVKSFSVTTGGPARANEPDEMRGCADVDPLAPQIKALHQSSLSVLRNSA